MTKFALTHNRVFLLAAFLIFIAGPLSFLSHPSREDPKITIKTALVTASYPGMSPERMENLITRKIEEKIREIPEVEEILSTTQTGKTVIRANLFEKYSNVEPIWNDLRNKMDDLKPDLPENTTGPFINDDYGNVAMATVALTAEGFSLAEMRTSARSFRDSIYAIGGVRKVELFGVEEERIFIEFNLTRLSQMKLSPNVIVDTLSKQNIILPGGEIEAAPLSMTIEPSGNFKSVEDISNLTIEIPESPGQVAYLRDIATIKRAYIDPPKAPALYNGKPAIVISVAMVDKYDTFKFGEEIKSFVKNYETTLPIGYQLNFLNYQPADIQTAIFGVLNNLWQTILIVLVVVMLFLGWRSGLIVGGIMVPLTMLTTLLVMRYLDIELERMSLATLIISLGLLVDNGIVIVEEITRRLSLGEDRRQAVIATGNGLALPLLSSSLTTIFAFMPLMLSDSTAGEYTRSISLVIAITLLVSWMISMTIVPMLGYWLIKRPADTSAQDDGEPSGNESELQRQYSLMINYILDNRLKFLGLIGGLFVLSQLVFSYVPKVFFPNSERTEIQLLVDHRVGTTSRASLETTKKVTAWLNNKTLNPEIINTVAYVASGGPRFYLALNPPDPDPHRAYILVKVHHPDQVAPAIAKYTAEVINRFPQARIGVKPLSMGAGEAGLVQYRVSGPDPKILKSIADRILTALHAIPAARNIRDDWENQTTKLIVDVDQARARRLGITSEDIARTLNALLSGTAATQYREDDLSIPVIIRAEETVRTNLDRLRTLQIPTADGSSIPLIQLAKFRGEAQFPLIQRRDQVRTITIDGKSAIQTAAELHATMKPTLDAINMPPGYRIEVGGEIADSSKAQSSLFKYMPLAFGLILLVLVWQFGSFRRTAIVLLTIPLSFIGISYGLFLAPGANFGFMALLGLLALAGIIINNGIVLIDRIEIERAQGLELKSAIISACEKRLRPILMTTATTILGLAPIILSKDVLFYDLAIVISSGLIIGTVLTLGFVPMLYLTFFNSSTLENVLAPAAED